MKPHTTASTASTAVTDTVRLRDMHPDPRSRIMARLWTRMSGIYGASRWEREYGADPARAWEDGLGGATLNQITEAISIAERDTTGRIPTLGLFRSWCLSTPVDHFEPLPSLPHIAGKTPEGRRWLAFMHFEGILPMPEGVTLETVGEALEDSNIAEMREQVRVQRAHLENRYHSN